MIPAGIVRKIWVTSPGILLAFLDGIPPMSGLAKVLTFMPVVVISVCDVCIEGLVGLVVSLTPLVAHLSIVG